MRVSSTLFLWPQKLNRGLTWRKAKGFLYARPLGSLFLMSRWFIHRVNECCPCLLCKVVAVLRNAHLTWGFTLLDRKTRGRKSPAPTGTAGCQRPEWAAGVSKPRARSKDTVIIMIIKHNCNNEHEATTPCGWGAELSHSSAHAPGTPQPQPSFCRGGNWGYMTCPSPVTSKWWSMGATQKCLLRQYFATLLPPWTRLMNTP